MVDIGPLPVLLSPAEIRELAQKPCWCIGCHTVKPWEDMRWDGPHFICERCLHDGCCYDQLRIFAKDGRTPDHQWWQTQVKDCEQQRHIQHAYWEDWAEYETAWC